MTFEEASAELRRHRDLALANHARDLLSEGATVEDAAFHDSLARYAVRLEKWRRDAIARLRKIVAAASKAPQGSLH